MNAQLKPSKRLLSLDVLRGITIVGMILVNEAGACGFGYAPLRHAKWDGFTPADVVFPMFLFLMGISTYISLRKHDFNWRLSLGKVIKRATLLILIGVVMKWIINSSESGNWLDIEHLRFMGVMQRLGICYGATAIMALFIPHKRFLLTATLLLAGYFLLQLFGNGFEKTPDNIIGIIDSAILGTNHMYLQGRQFVDPEGVMSSIPAIAQVMIGFTCGRAIITNKDNRDRMILLFIYGTAMLFIGYLFSYADPINKRLWSPSFVLVTSGIAALSLATLIYVIDIRDHKKWGYSFEIFGANPLVLYVASCLIGEWFRLLKIPDYTFTAILQPIFGDYLGSFMYAVFLLLILGYIGYILLKKQIYIKL